MARRVYTPFEEEPPLELTAIEREREKRAIADQKKRLNKDIFEWLAHSRLELVGSCYGHVMIISRRVMKRGDITLYQDFSKKPEKLLISELGPHGRRRGEYLPFCRR